MDRLHVSALLHNVAPEPYTDQPLPAFTLWRSTIVYGAHDTHTRVEGLRGTEWIVVASRSFHIEANGKATLRVMLRRLQPELHSPRSDRAEAKLTITDIAFKAA